ncbi:ATP-binding protein [bacterium]|nr:ATP-binding protein [bacterium]
MKSHYDDPSLAIDNLFIGTIIEVDGTHIVAELDTNIAELTRNYAGRIYPIGQFGSIIKIHFGRKLIYAYVGRLRMKSELERQKGVAGPDLSNARVIEADLFGEGEWVHKENEWQLQFLRGISTYPLPQQKVYLTPSTELKYVYGGEQENTIKLGEHVGTNGTPCYADMNELLGLHTAILGSTGAGKSGTVAAILHSILERGKAVGYDEWKPQIIILDPHNEYGAAFPGHRRLSTDEDTLQLPYWMFNLAEFTDLLVGKTEFAATSETNIVKRALLHARQQAAIVVDQEPDSIVVDAPVPFDLNVFQRHIEDDRPTNKDGSISSKADSHERILRKLDVLRRDNRLRFMMANWDGESDPFTTIASQFLGTEEPIRIVDLSGVPNEIAGAASSIVARLLFSYKVWQNSDERRNSPVLFVCEEAHRYVPNRGEAQYHAAQDAIRRIAKEGRKYGIGMFVVSQRPSEVEPTVLSQCNSWIVLRITNDNDRNQVRAILPDSLAGLTKVLSGLGKREAVFVGQAATLPSRIQIRMLEKEQLPQSHNTDFDAGWQHDSFSPKEIQIIGRRWRTQSRE